MMVKINNVEFDISEKNKIMINVENTVSQIQTIKQLLNDINFGKYMKNQDDNILLDTMRLRMQILINKLPNKMEYLEHDDENIYCQECNSDVILIDDDLDKKEVIILTKKPRKKYPKKKCPHGKQKSVCVDCGGVGICVHNKRRERCVDCGGVGICLHGIQKETCKPCGGSSRCIHDKLKQICNECKGGSICEHNKRKSRCIKCDGSGFCKHGKNKTICKPCGGSAYCIHDKLKTICIICKGGSICEHNKEKRYCRLCDGSRLCKSELCETTINSKYEGYCLLCYVDLFPDKPISRNHKTKELNVANNVKNYYPYFIWICDKQIRGGCSKKRPDMLVDLGTHIIIVEVDEDAHADYDSLRETKRMMELSKDVGGRPIVFIRFNPDKYIDRTGEVVKSCWKIDNITGIFHIDTQKEDEWKDRLLDLNDEIQYWIDNLPKKTIEIVKLFY
jgi:hypothetical protein